MDERGRFDVRGRGESLFDFFITIPPCMVTGSMKNSSVEPSSITKVLPICEMPQPSSSMHTNSVGLREVTQMRGTNIHTWHTHADSRERGYHTMSVEISTRRAPPRSRHNCNRQSNKHFALTIGGRRDVELFDPLQRLRVVHVTLVRPPPVCTHADCKWIAKKIIIVATQRLSYARVNNFRQLCTAA